MADIRGKISAIYALEQLADGKTSIHALHPFAKLLGTMAFILSVVSFDRYELMGLVPFFIYPVAIMRLAKIPYALIGKRSLAALPFCLFAGISNLFFDTAVFCEIGSITVSYGAVSFIAIIIRSFLCVAAALILIAVTPFTQLSEQLRRLRVPQIFVALLEMTYRYVGVLLEEGSAMYMAYRLRGGDLKGVQMRHMGSFIGQMLLRSFDRAERVYQAMQCRGYPMHSRDKRERPLKKQDYLYICLVCGGCLLFRMVSSPFITGRGILC